MTGAQEILTDLMLGGGREKNESSVVAALQEVVLILAGQFGNKVIQSVFIEHLLCSWHYVSSGDPKLNKTQTPSILLEVAFQWGRQKKKLCAI